MTYPATYAFLTEEELVYTTGGEIDGEMVGNVLTTVFNVGMSVLAVVTVAKNVKDAIKNNTVDSLLLAGGGVLGSALTTMNVSNIGGVAAQLKHLYPDEYPEDEGTINLDLLRDSTIVYFTSPIGALMGVANASVAVGYLYLMFC